MSIREHTSIIAEAGVNHNGDLDLAIELVDRAAEAGADYVKFQTFRAAKLASASASKAAYQNRTTDAAENQLEMLRRLELGLDAHRVLIDRCAEKGTTFLSTPFDLDSLAFLTGELGLKTLKLGSGELTNAPILLAAARSGQQLLLSTGMGSLAEVEEALGVLAFGLLNTGEPSGRASFAQSLTNPEAWPLLRERVTLLHCTTEYPAAIADANLRAIDTMRTAFGVRVGYSDHSEGNALSLAAVARGATVIEKHFTIDRTLPGPDHAASIEPDELNNLVRDIRTIEMGLGNGIKQPGAAELANRPIVRRSVVAVHDLAVGTVLTSRDITAKRAGAGIPAMDYWDCIGRKVLRNRAADEPLQLEDVQWSGR